jgi:hypothetical protein
MQNPAMEIPTLVMLAEAEAGAPTGVGHGVEPGVEPGVDPGVVVLTCANCGAQMDERKCKLICACGYFLSCSDYY